MRYLKPRATMNRHYEELAESFSRGYVGQDEESFSYLLEEARKRHDGDVVADLAGWIEDIHDTCPQSIELYKEAAALGSPKANFRIASEYRTGEFLPKDYEKAYSCYLKSDDWPWDWVPIDPEESTVIMEDFKGEVEVDYLLSVADIGWWMFVLEKHPTRALKCGMAEWYMREGGTKNREKALQLYAESALAGFEFAFFRLVEFYAKGEYRNLEKGRYWYRKAGEFGFDEYCYVEELGIESLGFIKLKTDADAGDCVAAAKVACTYLHGHLGDYELGDFISCPKDEQLALHYGKLACSDEEGENALLDGLDNHNLADMKFLSKV